jgi:hypothetical protein
LRGEFDSDQRSGNLLLILYQHRETTVMDAVKSVLGFDK